LTNLGIVKAVQVDQSDKILLFSQTSDQQIEGSKDGVYLFDSGSNSLPFFPPLKTLALSQRFPVGIDFKTVKTYLSYDSKQVILDFPQLDGTTISYLLSLDNENQEPLDVTSSKDVLILAWQKEKQAEDTKILETFPKQFRAVASDSFSIISFSPDQTKVLYRSKRNALLPLVIKPPLIAADQTPEERIISPNRLYVYDRREDKNFNISDGSIDAGTIRWYSDSKHLVFKETRQMAISLYDGKNRQVVYSGPLEEDFFSVNSSGSLLILADLNPQSNKFPDLYAVGLK